MARFGTGRFGQARFGVEEASDLLALESVAIPGAYTTDILTKLLAKPAPEPQLDLLETLQKSFAKALVDSASLADELRNALAKSAAEALALSDDKVFQVSPSAADLLGLADTAWQGFSANLADALALAEAAAKVVAAAYGDASTLSDLLSASAQKALDDALSLAESCSAVASLERSDALLLADGFGVAVAKALSDTLALADAISSLTGASRADALSLADALALAFALELDVFGRQNLITNGSFEKGFTRVYDDGGSKRIYKPENWNVNYYFDNCTEMLVLEETGDVRWGGKAVRMRTNAPDPTNLSLNMTSVRFPIDETTYVEFGARWKSVAGGWTLGDVTFHFYGPSGEYLGRRWAYPTQYDFTEDNGWRFRSWIFRPSDGATLPPGGSGTDPYIPPGSVSAYMQIYFNWHGAGAREGIIDAAFVRVWDHEPTSEERQQAAALADVALADAWLREYAPQAHAETVGISDEEAVKSATLRPGDLLALTDSLVKAAASSLSDALTLAEAVPKAVQALTAEAVTPTDALQSAVAKTLADVAGIADVVRSAVDAYPGRASLFGLARFGHEYFDNQQPGEAVSLRDAIASEIGFGVLAEDLSSLADAIRSVVEALLQDNPALLDALTKGLVAPKAESAGASDAVALQVARAVESVISASDALLNLAASKGITDSVAPLVDALASSAAKVLELSLALGDEAARAVAKGVAEVSLSLAEAIEFGADVETQSAAYLADAGMRADVGLAVGGAQFDRAWFGLARFGDAGFPVFTEDELAKAVSALLLDAVSQIDALALQAVKAGASSMALGEALLLAAEKAAGEQANVVDLNAFAVAKSLGLSVTVADDIAKAVAAALQGLSATTADEIQVALAMLRQAHDEMAVVDGAVRAINLLRDELLALADEARRDIEAKQAETLAIASALGKDVAHFPPGDLTGLLDEAQFMAAFLAGDIMAPLVDSATGEVYHVLSQVFINGVSVVTRGLQIKESVASRVGECSFTIPDPSPQVLSLCKQGADVHVYLSDSGENIVWGGRIVSASVVSVSALVREVRIVAQDYATRAQSVLVSGAWIQTKYTDIVRALWEQYAPEDNLVLDVADNPKVAEKWVVKWESLAEATDAIAQVLGWTWRVDWDGGRKVFRFFDPGAEVHPKALSVGNLNIAAGTAEFGQDEEIVNSVYVLGGQALYQPDPYREVADGQKTYFILPSRPFEPITVKVDGVEKAWAYETYYWPEGKDCLINPEGRYVRFQTPPAAGSVLEVSYQATRPVRCHLTEPGSIAIYGVRDQVINDSKIADPLQAREAARKILREKAWPKQHGRMEVYEPGLRAGKIVHVYLPDRGIDGLYQVSEVSWTVDRAVLRRDVSLNRIADAEAGIAQVIRNLAQRVAALEAEKYVEHAVIDRFIDQSHRLKLSAGADWLGEISYGAASPSFSMLDLLYKYKRTGNAIETWAEEAPGLADSAKRWPTLRKAESAGVSFRAKVSTSRFGYSRFGEARAGAEVVG